MIDNVSNPATPKLYLVGNFSSPQIVLSNSNGSSTYNNTANSINSFVLKFEANILERTTIDGIWSRVLNNDGIIGVNQIATDEQTRQLYIARYYNGMSSGLGGPFGSAITNTRTGEAALAGYVASLDASDGIFYRLINLGGAVNAPAAANVTIAGRVTKLNRQGVSQTRITMTAHGGVDRIAITNPSGYYRFDDVPAGQFYIFSAVYKSWGRTITQAQNIQEDRDNLDFIAPRSDRAKAETDRRQT